MAPAQGATRRALQPVAIVIPLRAAGHDPGLRAARLRWPSSRSGRCCRSFSPRSWRSASTRPSARSSGAAGDAGARRWSSSPRCSPRVRDRADHRRARVGPDRRVRPRAARATGTSSRSKPGSRTLIVDRRRRRQDRARRSRSSPPGLPDAANALLGIAGGVFGSLLSLVTLTFLALFLLMERPTITDWLFGFTPPEVEARWRPVVEDSIRAVSSSLIGNVAISIIAAHGRRPVGVGVRPAVPARAGRDHRPARPDPAGRRDGRRRDPRRRRADGQHPRRRSRC